MNWKHLGIYESLKLRGHEEKVSETNKYIFLTSYNQLRNSFAILYHPNKSTGMALRWPLHLILNHDNWDPKLDEIKELALLWKARRVEVNKGWGWYEIMDWDAFANALKLD